MRSFLLFIVLTFIAFGTFAQETEESSAAKQKVTIYLVDGTKLIGTFERLTSDTLYFTHDVLGYQKIPQSALKKFEFGAADEEDAPVFVQAETENFYRTYGFGTLNHNRYSLTPNGFGPEKGESYFKSIMGFINYFDFGLSDHFSLQFGTVVFILPGISMKYHGKIGPRSSLGISGGILLLPPGTFSDNATRTAVEAAPFGTFGLTLGERKKNISGGIGVVIANGFAVPAFFMGGNIDLSESISLTFEMPYIGAGITGNTQDAFLPMFMPKVFTKRSMWGLGVTYPLSYDRVTENWESTTFLPVIVYSRRMGPIGPKN